MKQAKQQKAGLPISQLLKHILEISTQCKWKSWAL